ncbi:type VI secretion system baseplate subunit TssG [Acidocella sp.]|uniref:type VI secretion system baseplate subunit TssG n=1 Tax=Acidocella sp. TaxID=50710 RepID=UPI003CFF94CE
MALKSPLERLAAKPYLFQFDAAVRLLRLSATDRHKDDAIQFAAPPSLAQPAAEVLEAHPSRTGKRAKLVTTLIGLTGPSAEMPRWYTELLAQSYRQKSRAVLDFFDLLAQRLVAAFAQAGGKYRLPRSAEQAAQTGADEPIGSGILAFAGFNAPNLENRLAVGADALRHYAGFFSAHPRSSSRLASMVSDYLGRPVEIREFMGAWLPIPPDQQSRLPRGRMPGAFCALGTDAAIGTRAWDQQARFIVRIGPLTRAEFELLLPDKPRLPALVSLIRAYVGWETDFAINLILNSQDIPPLSLGAQPGAARLGWTSWIPSSTSSLKNRVMVDETMFSAEIVERLSPGRPGPTKFP